MSFAWDSRAAKLDGFFSGRPPSFTFFTFFLPPSFTLGTLGGFGALGILGGLGGFGGLVAFFLASLSWGGVDKWVGDIGSSGSEGADGGSSAGGLELLNSLFMALVAFWMKKKMHNYKATFYFTINISLLTPIKAAKWNMQAKFR